jgi:hypothetical protein
MSLILLSWTRKEKMWCVLAHRKRLLSQHLTTIFVVNRKHCLQFSYEMGCVVGKIPHLFCADRIQLFPRKSVSGTGFRSEECRIQQKIFCIITFHGYSAAK